jgi:hypothetical protein
MTMSKYERRVLAELEAELTRPEGRWESGRAVGRRMCRGAARVRGTLRREVAALAVIVVAVAVCAPTIVYAPGMAAASITAVLGAIAGCLATVLWRSRQRTFRSQR